MTRLAQAADRTGPHRLGAVLALALGGVALFVAGCEKPEGVAHYTVAKPVPLDPLPAKADPHAGLNLPPKAKPTGEPTDRMLGAIVPHGDQVWFFKLLGPKDPVAAQTEAFTALLKSIQFSAEGKPAWTLPSGWQERSGPPPRFATLSIPSEGKPLETTVSVLPNSSDALSNVNRWRGQLSLPPITAEQLADESTQVELADGKATFVNLLGHAAPGGMRASIHVGSPRWQLTRFRSTSVDWMSVGRCASQPRCRAA